MDKVTIVLAAIKSISRFIPRKPPPQPPNLAELYQESYRNFFPDEGVYPREAWKRILDEAMPVSHTTVRDVTDEAPDLPTPQGVATACMSCTRSHLATVAGAWEEALRFAREKGLGDPEVIKRLSIAEKELNIMERIDLSPASIEASPHDQQALARKFLPELRVLRQKAGEISTVADLEKAAAMAEVTGSKLRMDILESKGVDVKGIASLVKKVESKEITVDQAKEQLHSMIPRS